MNATANPAAERAVLGIALQDSTRLHEIISDLQPNHFSTDANRRIFAAIIELANAGKPVDIVTVSDVLGRRSQLDSVGGAGYIADLTTGCVPASTKHHTTDISNRAKRREIITACQRAISQAEDSTIDTPACVAGLNESLLSIEAANARTQAKHVSEILPAVIRELECQSAQQGLVGMPTGIDALDIATGGIRPGQLWVVGALPGRGKTALGVQTILAAADAGIPAAVFSLEMAHLEIVKRMLAARSRISASRLHNPSCISKQEWSGLLESAGEISEHPIWIDDSPTLEISELISRAKLYIRRHGAKLVVVDYLRLVSAPGRELRERVGFAADALRQLAKTEQVGVVLLSQLRRPENINARPNLIDLKESGDIEAHAHVVLLLYMPIASDGKPTGEEEIIIGKNRVGPIGSVPVFFDSKRLQFVERQTSQ
jgi:replicative DNA helicase